jgi:anti-sigma factor RsiW
MTDPAPLTCAEFVELVTEYLEGTLDPQTRTRFEIHLGVCPGCVTYLDQIRETVQVAGRLTEDNLSEPARTHLLDAFRDWHAG